MSATEERAKYSYRPAPQLSASQMAEYLSGAASSTRRKSIIREARFPKTSVVAQYSKGREGLVNFLTDGTRSFKHIADAVDYLDRRAAKADASTWMKRDCQGSKEAISVFERSYNKLPFRKLDCRPIPGRLPLIDLWPTKISVAIDFAVHRPTTEGKDRIGGAILLFSRGEASSKTRIERSKIIAGLIHVFCGRFMHKVGDADPDLCFAVDVFNGTAHSPPGTFVRKLRNIEDACDEIAAQWNTIKAPVDYDGPDPD